jgi:hypothetical protein
MNEDEKGTDGAGKGQNAGKGTSMQVNDGNEHGGSPFPLMTEEQEKTFKSVMAEKKMHWLTYEISTSDGDQKAHCICTQEHADLIRRGIERELAGRSLSNAEMVRFFALTRMYKDEVKSQLGLDGATCHWKVTHVDGRLMEKRT